MVPVIRAARREDIPALAALLQTLFAIEQDFVPDPECQERGLALLFGEGERAHVFVAEDELGRVVGMVSAQLVTSTAEGALSAWVEDMVVAKEYRRQGLGRRLLEAALEWSAGQGATRAQLLVDTDNEPGLAFYRRLGWRATHLLAHRFDLSSL